MLARRHTSVQRGHRFLKGRVGKLGFGLLAVILIPAGSALAQEPTLTFTCNTDATEFPDQIGDTQSNVPQSKDQALTTAKAVVGDDLTLEDVYKATNSAADCLEGTWSLTNPDTDVCAIGIHAGNGYSIFKLDTEASSGVWQSPVRIQEKGANAGEPKAPANLSNLFAFTCSNTTPTDNFADLKIKKQFDDDPDRVFSFEVSGDTFSGTLGVNAKDDEIETVPINLGDATSGTVTLKEVNDGGLEAPEIQCGPPGEDFDASGGNSNSGSGFQLSNINVEANKTTKCLVTNESSVTEPNEGEVVVEVVKISDKPGNFTVKVDGESHVFQIGEDDVGHPQTESFTFEVTDDPLALAVSEDDLGEGFLDPEISCSIVINAGSGSNDPEADEANLTGLEGGRRGAMRGAKLWRSGSHVRVGQGRRRGQCGSK